MDENKKKDEKKTKQSRNGGSVVTVESVSAVLALFSILALLILCTNTLIFGEIGNVLSHFLLGTFGYGAYPLFAAVVFFSFAAFVGKKPVKNVKLFLCVSATVACVMFIAHIAATYSLEAEGYLGQVFDAGAKFTSATVVGWLGSLVTYALSSIVSKVGALILFSLLTLGCGYLSYLLIKKGSKKEEKKEEISTEQPAQNQTPYPAQGEWAQSQAPYQGYQPQGYPEQPTVPQSYAPYTANPTQAATPAPSTTQENPFNDTGAYSSYAMPDVSQRPGVSLPNDHKSNIPRPSYVDPYADEKAVREFLFGSTARENFSRNQLFDKSSRVNARFDEMQSRLSGNTPPQQPSYTTSYEDELNARGAIRSGDLPERRADVFTPPVSEPTIEPTVERRDPFSSFETQQPSRFDTSDYTSPRESYLSEPTPERESFLDVKDETPTRDEFGVSQESSGEDYRRHDYMDLFSADNPRLLGEEDRLGEFTPEASRGRFEEELPPVRGRDEDVLSARNESFDDRMGIFDEKEDEPEESSASRFDELPRIDSSRFTPVEPPKAPPQPTFRAPEPTPPPAPVVKKPKPRLPYKSAPSDFFDYRDVSLSTNIEEIEEAKEVIISTLVDYKIANPQIASTTYGPTVTRYNVSIPRTVSPKKIIQLDQEIAMQLFAKDGVNIYANYEDCVVSIEVPNKNRQFVQLGCMLTGEQYVNAKPTSLVFAMGKDVANRKVYGDFTQMIHLLVAGTSGSGKSVLLNTMIVSLINKYSPAELRMILIDPKQNEFIVYAGLPHLIVKDIITDAKRSVQALNWAIGEMHRRNKLFADKTLAGTRVVNVDEYNAHVDSPEEKLPRILIIIDELADLMLAAKKDIEEKIQALTQMSRSAGIHVVVSTQRPSTDVITGVIKSNLGTRIACKVPTDVDSRVILDQTGAQKLLGKGDFLYTMPGESSPIRVQSAFISSDDIQRVVDYIKFNNQPDFDEDVEKYISSSGGGDSSMGGASGELGAEEDMQEFVNAVRVFIEAGRASATLLVGKLRIGFTKAARLVDQMAELNYISQYDGAKARKVYITMEQLEEKYGDYL